MSDKPTIPAPQYTLIEAHEHLLSRWRSARLAEVRALARLPGPPGPKGERGPAGEKGERGVKGEHRPQRRRPDAAAATGRGDGRSRHSKPHRVTTQDGGRTLRWAMGDVGA